jgi:predicted GTPase
MFIDSETQAIDESQKRAFKVIVSMFVITFHEEAERNEGEHNVGTQDPRNRSKYHKLLRELKKLSGMKKSRQLILFMTGAGGSGKTRVINAVMAYAKGFCKALNYMFDKRMIVLTALTGVAATLINGETTHSAAKLNFKQIKMEHIEEWKNA